MLSELQQRLAAAALRSGKRFYGCRVQCVAVPCVTVRDSYSTGAVIYSIHTVHTHFKLVLYHNTAVVYTVECNTLAVISNTSSLLIWVVLYHIWYQSLSSGTTQ
jgi:hypothetical protein